MYLIVGLGNPESDYANTRHNMGFDVINEISKKCDIKVSKSKFNALYGMGEIENNKVILVKPQTYMNLSGESIIQFKKFYKISNKNIIVIYDDIDLKIGDIITAYYSPEKPEKISRPIQNQSYVVIIGIASFLIIDFIITVILRKKGILNKHRYIPKKYRL